MTGFMYHRNRNDGTKPQEGTNLTNMFILKTNSDSQDFEKKLNQFLSNYCKDNDTNAALIELNEKGKQKAKEIISA